MKSLVNQLKWQLVLLQKNNIISISVGVTLMYALIFMLVRHLGNLDKVLTAIVLNDPAVISFFFAGLAVIIEKRQNVLSALFVTPINHHVFLISRVLSLSFIAWLCGFGLAISALGFSFNLFHYSMGVLGISLLSALLGMILVSYTSEFLRFTMLSAPVFLVYINVPLLDYLGVMDMGIIKNIFPIQGGLNLIVHSYSESLSIGELLINYGLLSFWIGLIYVVAYKHLKSKIVNG